MMFVYDKYIIIMIIIIIHFFETLKHIQTEDDEA